MTMTKEEFLTLLGRAYDFPAYYSNNLDSADEILMDKKEAAGVEQLSLEALFHALLSEAEEAERAQVWMFVRDHFSVERDSA